MADWECLIEDLAPLSWWKHDDADGTAILDSGSLAKTSTVTGPLGANYQQTPIIPASPGYGKDINVTSVYNAEVDNSAADYAFVHQTGIFTFLFWVNFDVDTTVSQDPFLSSSGTQSEKGFIVWQSLSTLEIQVYNGSGSNYMIQAGVSGSILRDNDYFLAVTGDGSVCRMYINGVEQTIDVGSATIGATATGDMSRNLKMLVGNYTGGPGFANSKLDDFVVFDKTLSAAQILQLYEQSGECPGTSPGTEFCRLLARDGTSQGEPIVSRNPPPEYILVRRAECDYGAPPVIPPVRPPVIVLPPEREGLRQFERDKRDIRDIMKLVETYLRSGGRL